jgi:hypothetical protein
MKVGGVAEDLKRARPDQIILAVTAADNTTLGIPAPPGIMLLLVRVQRTAAPASTFRRKQENHRAGPARQRN